MFSIDKSDAINQEIAMSSANTINPIDLGFLGQPVEISKIETELQRLFMEELPKENDTSESGGKGVARASLLNLAVYREDSDRSSIESDNADLEQVAGEAACRSILVSANTAASDSNALAWVQARCQLVGSGKTVCTEQISFCIDGDSQGLARNMIFANLDSDLPLVFWWRGEFSDTFEESLYSRIDRLIFDSEKWESPRNQFLRLAEGQKSSTSPFAVHDLAFTRLNPVRQAFANLFDRPGLQSQVSSLKNIEILHHRDHRMSGLYLAAWVAQRLGKTLQPEKSNADEFVFSGDDADAQLRISIGEEPEMGENETVTVRFDLGKNRSIAIGRCPSNAFLRTTITSGKSDDELEAEEWLPDRSKNNASLVVEILNRAGRNRGYLKILPLIQHILTV